MQTQTNGRAAHTPKSYNLNEILHHSEVSSHLRHEVLNNLRKTAYAYLDVLRHETNQLLSAFGAKTAYASIAILTGTVGFAWLTVLLGFYLASLMGWYWASFIVAALMFVGAGVAYGMQKKQNEKAKEAVQEIGNEILSGRIDQAQTELEESLHAATKETLHDVRPDVVLKKFVIKNPNSAVIGSILAGALVGYSQLRKR
jgi:hypothetical protein